MSSVLSGALYRVIVMGPGLSFEREVEREVADQVILLLLTGTANRSYADDAKNKDNYAINENVLSTDSTRKDVVRKLGPEIRKNVINIQNTDAPLLSLREYLDESGAYRVPDKIAAFGVYLNDYAKKADFGRADLVQCFEAAAEPVPMNLARDLKWALRSGWIALRAGRRDLYYVTHTGRNAVGEKFSAEVVRKTRGMTSGTRKKDPSGEGGGSERR